MPRYIPDETKAAALADVLAGMSVKATAEKYGVSRAAVMDWANQAGVATPVLHPEALHDVGSALARFMCASLDALTDQVQYTRKVNWLDLKSDRADAFTKLYRVLAESIAGVVAAQQVAEETEAAPTPIRRAG